MRKGTRRLLMWLTVSSAALGPAFVLRGTHWFDSVVSSPAYHWAGEVLPFWFYGVIWLTVAVMGMAILAGVLSLRWQYPMLGLFSFNQVMFAISIFTLTPDNPGAYAGTLQWGGYLYFTLAVLVDRDPRGR
jgi:hypothetical protein